MKEGEKLSKVVTEGQNYLGELKGDSATAKKDNSQQELAGNSDANKEGGNKADLPQTAASLGGTETEQKKEPKKRVSFISMNFTAILQVIY